MKTKLFYRIVTGISKHVRIFSARKALGGSNTFLIFFFPYSFSSLWHKRMTLKSLQVIGELSSIGLALWWSVVV